MLAGETIPHLGGVSVEATQIVYGDRPSKDFEIPSAGWNVVGALNSLAVSLPHMYARDRKLGVAPRVGEIRASLKAVLSPPKDMAAPVWYPAIAVGEVMAVVDALVED